MVATVPKAAPPVVAQEVTMEVDEIAESREEQDRLREQSRVDDKRTALPSGPRNPQSGYDNYYDRRSRQPAPYGGRYGYAGGDRYSGNSQGRYYDDSRRYGGSSGWR